MQSVLIAGLERVVYSSPHETAKQNTVSSTSVQDTNLVKLSSCGDAPNVARWELSKMVSPTCVPSALSAKSHSCIGRKTEYHLGMLFFSHSKNFY